MTVLAALPLDDTAPVIDYAATFAAALQQPLRFTALFDASRLADPASPADVVAAIEEATDALAALAAPAGAEAELSLRLESEPAWAPAVRTAITAGADLLVVDAARPPAAAHIGEVARAATCPVLALGPAVDTSPASPVRVLALSDGSDASFAIAPALQRLLAPTDVEVHLAAVAIPAVGERIEERELALAEALDRLAQRLSGVRVAARRVERIREFELLHTAIARLASESGATHLALATHGRGRALRFLLGSTAESLLRNSALPLLLVRAGDA